MSKIKFTSGNVSIKRLISLIAVSAVLAGIILFPASAFAATATSNARDCDDNAVFRCGALTSKEVQVKYMNPTDASGRYIINAFNITNHDLEVFDSTAVLGQVTKSGDVLVNGLVVANNAVTAGRLNMPGSTAQTYQGVTFYKRPPSVSFRSESIQAFVVMENNVFKFAILTSCGNPVNATPLVQPPAPVPQTTVVPPAAPAEKIIVVNQQVQTQQVVVQQPQPQPVIQVREVKAASTELPKTGASGIFGLGALISVIAGLGHSLVTRRKGLLGMYENFVLTKLYR